MLLYIVLQCLPGARLRWRSIHDVGNSTRLLRKAMSRVALHGASRLARNAALMAAVVLCLPVSRCYGDDLAVILRHMREGMSAIRSARARITVSVAPSAGYLASMRLEPGQTLLTHRTFDWAMKGDKWRIDEVDASRDETATTGFDGRTTLVFSRYGVQGYTRGTFLGTENPIAYTPLEQAYRMRGRPAADVLESDGFRLVRVEQDQTYGPLSVLEGHEFRAPTATTTVWVARARGSQIVRREMQVTKLGKTVTSDRTEAMERVSGVWMPTKVVREQRYPGRERIGRHVDDLPGDEFEAAVGVFRQAGVGLKVVQRQGRRAADREGHRRTSRPRISGIPRISGGPRVGGEDVFDGQGETGQHGL